ncbi:MAG TPA: hypothetical protein VMV15_03305 [Candidatus Binataceae bacterium]|nr:hypothetical protein [Candidatus Binataceae bacterium]
MTSWGWRLGGVVLVCFFALGVMAGVSPGGRALVARVDASTVSLRGRAAEIVAPVIFFWRGLPPVPVRPGAPGAVAIVERGDGFYALSEGNGLVGPISPQAQGDLPVLSGAGVQNAPLDELLRDASIVVRAEATLSALISEMRVDDDGVATLFLVRSQTRVTIDLDAAPLELERASELLTRWRDHQRLVAGLDLTTPGQAVMELRGIRPFDLTTDHLQRVAGAGDARARGLGANGRGITGR